MFVKSKVTLLVIVNAAVLNVPASQGRSEQKRSA